MQVGGQFYAPAALSLGEKSRYPSDRRLGGLQRRSGRGGEEKKNSCPCRESNPGRLARSLVTILKNKT
jgi:hypothetical protein